MTKPDKYRVRNWAQFQHYKDRNPAWIKLHLDLLTSEEWMLAPTDNDRLLLIVVMLVAARKDNVIPANPAYLRKVGCLDFDPDITWLVDTGFLVPCDEEDKWESPWPSRHVSAADRDAIMKRDGHRCVVCAATEKLEIDHIIPVSRGGTSQIGNLQVLCRSCNRKKRTQVPAISGSVAVATQSDEQRSLERETYRDIEKREKERGGANAPTDFAFVGRVIRLSVADFNRWRETYHGIRDMVAELTKADDYYSENPTKDGKWFFPVSKWLDRAHRDALAGKADPDEAIYRGVM